MSLPPTPPATNPTAVPPAQARPDLRAPLPQREPKPNRWVPLLVLLLGIGIAYASFRWALGALIHSRTVVTVPEIEGKSVADALNLLAQVHLGLIKEGEQFDKRYPAGTIVRQSPVPGMSVREGRMIKITLSQGGQTLFVPELSGQPFRNAQTTLQNAGLGVGEVDHRPSLRFQKDEVMATDPPAGSVVSKNALVTIILSQGPPGSDVLLTPDFVGKKISEAKSWGEKNQVPIAVREENDSSKSTGEILMQAPVTDSPLRAGDTLTLVVNTGSGSASSGPRIRYEVPQGSSDRDIRILIIDETGEHEVYRKGSAPGSRIDIPATFKGRARARILSNGVLVDEQELRQP